MSWQQLARTIVLAAVGFVVCLPAPGQPGGPGHLTDFVIKFGQQLDDLQRQVDALGKQDLDTRLKRIEAHESDWDVADRSSKMAELSSQVANLREAVQGLAKAGAGAGPGGGSPRSPDPGPDVAQLKQQVADLQAALALANGRTSEAGASMADVERRLHALETGSMPAAQQPRGSVWSRLSEVTITPSDLAVVFGVPALVVLAVYLWRTGAIRLLLRGKYRDAEVSVEAERQAQAQADQPGGEKPDVSPDGSSLGGDQEEI